MKTQREKIENCVLVYSDDRDPSREETAQALAHMQPLPAEEIVPGTIRVKGRFAEISRHAADLAHWQLSREKIFKLNPPAKAMLR
ncbi:hypothetical protein [Paracoccus shanxieyensis]|uniref:Uncharacterized protein n=1 Tax=Paracoccus shanxieyensis TaxID=2675752 RepID=A0A6L6IYS3_9RHOB|nr:hypothetical protein [Paracoccus shanxieyensis]MTH65646.1 hypothetical protein [Paracoccus shanxieyensis]MTH88779.1 hypothetical protein [Paracoccus shanxieyensis]